MFRSLMLKVIWYGALRQYRMDQPIVIAIGGSVGKTSTKEAVALLLGQTDTYVTKTHGNLATDFGVALSILGFTDTPAGYSAWLRVVARSLFWRKKRPGKQHYYVLEYSSDKAGDTKYLTSKIPPHLAILTPIVPVHMEQYGTEEVMVNETVSIIDDLPDEGVIIASADDAAHTAALHKERVGKRRLVWYGIAKSAPKKPGVWAHEIKVSPKGLTCELSFVGTGGMDALTFKGQSLKIRTKVLGSYQLYPLLAMAAVGQALRLAPGKIKAGFEQYELPNGRGRLIEGRQNMTIIDDTANASPEAVKAGLSLLKPLAGSKRKVAILGTMNELGALSEDAHKDVARYAATHASALVAVGKYAPQMVKAAKAAGMAPEQAIGFATPEQLLSQLRQVVQRDDVIYIKASQNGMRLERVVKSLMAKPEEAAKTLVRQGSYWKKQH